MNLDHYSLTTTKSFFDFEFYSEGPKGKVKKIVRYSPQNANGITYFYLSFGDWNENIKEIDYNVVSDNMDRRKILATVALTILEFTSRFPDIMVYAQGSTPSRTRLYQMAIMSNWKEIQPLLHVFGFLNGHWKPFEKNVPYEAFLVLRKKL